MITILLADDHVVTRTGICDILSAVPDFQIVGEAQNGSEAQQLVAELQPQILLLDLKMPGLRSAVVEKWVRENYPETKTLILTAHDRDFYLKEMMDAGVTGYLNKSGRAESLIDAIRRAANNEILFTAEQFDRVRRWNSTEGKKWESLSRRERETIKLLVQGFDNSQIAAKLGISERTAIFHVTNLLQKLNVESRQQAAAWAIKHIPEMTEDL
jgi:two-component system, NarL family, response regulator LiaR